MGIYADFVEKYGMKMHNDINIKLFSKNKFSHIVDCIVITNDYKYLEIPHEILNNKQIVFINPDKDKLFRYIEHDNTLFVFHNDLPLYSRVFMEEKFNFGKLAVLNPYYKFPNTIWTIFTWYDIFYEKVLYDYAPKLNMKPMMSTMTISDIFSSYKDGPKLNIFINIDKYNLIQKYDTPQCNNCWLKPICKYRYYKQLRVVYRNCRNYLFVERNNYLRLLKIYMDYNIIEKCVDEDGMMTKHIKEEIYNAYI